MSHQDTIISRRVTRCQEPITTPDPDSTRAYLAMAREDIQHAIGHAGLANQDSRTDHLSLCAALDALRDALTAIEAEIEASDAQG